MDAVLTPANYLSYSSIILATVEQHVHRLIHDDTLTILSDSESFLGMTVKEALTQTFDRLGFDARVSVLI